MSAFDKIKQDVKTEVKDFEAKAQTDVKSSGGLVIGVAVIALAVGFILAKLL